MGRTDPRARFRQRGSLRDVGGDVGYRVTNVSALAPDAQFSLWANATDMVGVRGAGMINMIMMPSESGNVEIAGSLAEPNGAKAVYARINHAARCAMAAGHRVSGLSGSLNARRRPEFDLEKLETMLLDES